MATVSHDGDDMSVLPIDTPPNSEVVIDPDYFIVAAGCEINNAPQGFPAASVPQITIQFYKNDSSGKQPWDSGYTATTVGSTQTASIVDFVGTTTKYSWTKIQLPGGLYYNFLGTGQPYKMAPADWADLHGTSYPTGATPTLVAKLKIHYGYYNSSYAVIQEDRYYYMQLRYVP